MRCVSSRVGTFDTVGDENPVPVRADCSRLEWFASRAQNVPNIVRKERSGGMSELCPKDEMVSLQSE